MTITVPATSANLGPGFDTLGLAIKMRNSVTISPSKYHRVSLIGEGSKNKKLKDKKFLDLMIFILIYVSIKVISDLNSIMKCLFLEG